MTITPLQLAFYKGAGGKNGAIQFSPQLPHYYCARMECKEKDWNSLFPPECPKCGDKMKSREGALFVEITSTRGVNDYDWTKKIRMALNQQDLGKVLVMLESGIPEEELKIAHDPGAGGPNKGKVYKIMNISSPKGLTAGVYISVTMRDAALDSPITHKVPLSRDETRVLSTCIRSFIPKALNW